VSVVKVIEVIGQSEKGFDDAARAVVRDVAKTVDNIKSVWFEGFQCTVEDQKIAEYRVNAKVSFLVEGSK
jgi:flavin-binding protein dodecin